MILSNEALQRINDPAVRLKLMSILDVTEGTLIRQIKANKKNGPLTTVAAVKVIQKETKMRKDEILLDTGVAV